MNTTLIILIALGGIGYSQPIGLIPSANKSSPTVNQTPPSSDNEPTSPPNPERDKEKKAQSTIKPLTEAEQKELLATRLKGGMSYSFRQFANMFLVSSRLQIGTGVAIVTSDKKIAGLPLQSPFPASYQPTLREFLDAIGLQTFSEWSYDPSSKHFKSEVEHATPVEGLAFFEFKKRETKREKPYAVTLADGWKTEDNGSWVMYVPPTFPVGMDIYEMGTYSSDEEMNPEEFSEKMRWEIALEWAQRVNEKARQEDLKPAKVGTLEALFYEAMIPSQLGKAIRFRQWVFMVENKCYFIVSTILPELEDKIFPDVLEMVTSFRMKE